MNAVAEIALQPKVTVTTAPDDRVTLAVGSTQITLPASDVARLVIDQLMLMSGTALVASMQTGQIGSYLPRRIGAVWPAEGGIYAGVVRGDEGQPDYYLIIASEQREAITWKDAGEWAKALWIEGFRDFTLPKRKEQAVLFGNVPELFAKEWYWSCEENAGNPECAWCQYFDYGHQTDTRKNDKLRARAVRRVPIE